MTRTVPMLAVMALLGLIVAWEVMAPEATNQPIAARPTVAEPGQAAPPPLDASGLSQAAEQIVARPLLNPDRRPPGNPADAAAEDAATTEHGLPRLAGTIVGPNGGRAIFADANGKAHTAAEGDTIAGYVIQVIAPGAVTVAGAEGARVLHPTYIPAAPQTAGSAAPPPNAERPRGNPR